MFDLVDDDVGSLLSFLRTEVDLWWPPLTRPASITLMSHELTSVEQITHICLGVFIVQTRQSRTRRRMIISLWSKLLNLLLTVSLVPSPVEATWSHFTKPEAFLLVDNILRLGNVCIAVHKAHFGEACLLLLDGDPKRIWQKSYQETNIEPHCCTLCYLFIIDQSVIHQKGKVHINI